MTNMIARRMSGKHGLAALLLAAGLAAGSVPTASAQGFQGSNVDVDTGLRCLTQFCDYVRARRNIDCICKKNVRTYKGRRKVTLDCKIFNTKQTCEP